jgi:hypothetical protein
LELISQLNILISHIEPYFHVGAVQQKVCLVLLQWALVIAINGHVSGIGNRCHNLMASCGVLWATDTWKDFIALTTHSITS